MGDRKSVEEIDVKLQLSYQVTHLHAEWLAELYNQMTAKEGKDIIMRGRKSAGIP